MVITTRFELGAPVDAAWAYLLDVQKVAGCVPGGSVTEVIDDRTYEGKIEVRLGAIALGYKGRVTLEVDEPTKSVVIKAQGLESRGRGGASATTTATLTPSGTGGTSVEMNTDLAVTGIVAQFGRTGIMQEVAQRLAQRFANCIDQQLKTAAAAR